MHLHNQIFEHSTRPEGQHASVQSAPAHQPGNLYSNTPPQIFSAPSLCFSTTGTNTSTYNSFSDCEDEMKS